VLCVIDAGALTEILLRSLRAPAVEAAVSDRDLVAPAVIDAEILSALRGLERSGSLLPSRAAVAVEDLRLERTRGAGMLAAAPYDVDGAWPVRFRGGKLPVYKGGVDGLSLPLLHGDRLTIAGR
jgi:predicted nucleic acid-binding protein